jgi:hypothetical protein
MVGSGFTVSGAERITLATPTVVGLTRPPLDGDSFGPSHQSEEARAQQLTF